MKKKKRIKGWVWLAIGFISGIVYNNLFIYSDLITKADINEKDEIVQIDQEEQKSLESQKKPELERVEELEKYIEKCTLDEVSCKIKEVADSYEVDWRLAVAISLHETKDYTSVAFKDLNNVGGNYRYGSLMAFNSLDEGIDFFISHLKYEYIDIGLNTIETIQPKYAPIGADNDPNNLNENWIPGVSRRYKELAGK
jgi:hypothetical protein